MDEVKLMAHALKSPIAIAMNREGQQSEAMENLELADPYVNRVFRSWFSDVYHFERKLAEIVGVAKPEPWRDRDPLGPDLRRLSTLHRQFDFDLGTLIEDDNHRSRLSTQIWYAMRASACLVKDALIEVARYARTLEEENERLRIRMGEPK